MALLHQVSEEVQRIMGDIPVYAVGGSVRDTILGKDPKDFDYCSSASPEEVETRAKAAGRHVYTIGKKFGTIGFKVQVDKAWHYVEVTTFRKEVYEPNNRKPKVEFVDDLMEDLSRRDLTINAIAMKADGEYFDPFEGRIDISAKKIKAVGEATDRFKEDPLRMLRVARFAAQLNFNIDPNLTGKIRKMPEKILTISRERWVQEMDKLLVQDDFVMGLDILNDTYLMKFMLPEVWRITANDDEYLYEELCENVRIAGTDADESWAALLATIGKPYTMKRLKGFDVTYGVLYKLISLELAKGICLRLKFSNARTEFILGYLESQ
jgi:poly(A) polymerase